MDQVGPHNEPLPQEPSAPSSSLRETITFLEDRTWRAVQTHGSALVPFLAPDAIMIFPMGLKVSAKTKPSLNNVLYSDAFVPWKTYRMTDVEVVPVGEDGAVITYSVTAVRPPSGPKEDEEEFRALISSTWRRDVEGGNGGWRLVVTQQTPYSEEDVP